ncbi:MAG: MAP7 domain-containing protein [Bacteroidota bacterium]
MKKLFLALTILFFTNLFTFGQVPQATSFQGVLADSEGSVLSDGTYSLNFRLFDSAADGTMLWEETQDVATVGGIFNVILGQSTAFDLPFDDQYWLEIAIDGGDALSPRVKLTSSAYSLNTRSIPNNIVTAEKVADGNLVRSINTLKDSITLAAGNNVTISQRNNTITISAVGDGASDNLGDHTATQNINLNGNYLSGDGDNEGLRITGDGKIAINASNPYSTISVGGNGYNGYAIAGTDSMAGVYGRASGTAGRGVYGSASNSGDVTNYGGYFTASGKQGRGVYGYASGTLGYGVYGLAYNSGDVTNYGGYFWARGKYGRGVLGTVSGDFGYGVYGSASGSSGQGVYGYASNSGTAYNFGGYFEAKGSSGRGVYGYASNSGSSIKYGGMFQANGSSGVGVFGLVGGSSAYAVRGFHTDNNSGYLGTKYHGVYGLSNSDVGNGVSGVNYGSGDGVYGHSTSGYAGKFSGNVNVTGTLSKGGGSFKIDHPLDPQNKNLYHSFVESPDMMNIYNGNVTTDGAGNASIELPEWFEVLNKDFRYQLTVIGEFAQAIVSQKISNNSFSIKTDKPNVEVSWQVTGIRHDAFANANRIPVEEMKKSEERGKYLHPKAYGVSEEMGVDYDKKQELERIRKEGVEMDKIWKEEEQRLEKEKIRNEEENAHMQETEAERMRLETQQLEKQKNIMDN